MDHIYMDFGRNFYMCHLGAPPPQKFFDPQKVLIRNHLQNSYYGVTRKTHEDMGP